MTAVLYDEVVVPMPAPRLTAVPDPAPMTAPNPKASKRPDPQLSGDDLLVVGAARLLCVPLRQLYAALWRAGVLEVSS